MTMTEFRAVFSKIGQLLPALPKGMRLLSMTYVDEENKKGLEIKWHGGRDGARVTLKPQLDQVSIWESIHDISDGYAVGMAILAPLGRASTLASLFQGTGEVHAWGALWQEWAKRLPRKLEHMSSLSTALIGVCELGDAPGKDTQKLSVCTSFNELYTIATDGTLSNASMWEDELPHPELRPWVLWASSQEGKQLIQEMPTVARIQAKRYQSLHVGGPAEAVTTTLDLV